MSFVKRLRMLTTDNQCVNQEIENTKGNYCSSTNQKNTCS